MGDFFKNLNDKLGNFMVGRNGPDTLSRWALGAAIVVILIGTFVPSLILTMLSYALLFYSIYRMFSKNVTARRQKNEKFQAFLARFKGGRNTGGGTSGSASSTGRSANASSTASSSAQTKKPPAPDKAKVRFTCDNCGQSLSVPKGRGKLKVTCPSCHHQQTIDS